MERADLPPFLFALFLVVSLLGKYCGIEILML